MFEFILRVDLMDWGGETRDIATLPMSLGGLGVRSALRTSKAVRWASWADCLPMISFTRCRTEQPTTLFAVRRQGCVGPHWSGLHLGGSW